MFISNIFCLQVSVECSLGALSLAKGDRYGVGFPSGYNASSNTLFFIGLQVCGCLLAWEKYSVQCQEYDGG